MIEKKGKKNREKKAHKVGFDPTTFRLTAERATNCAICAFLILFVAQPLKIFFFKQLTWQKKNDLWQLFEKKNYFFMCVLNFYFLF